MSQSPFSEAINQLKPKEKEPRSARVLDGWIAQAQQTLGGEISLGIRNGPPIYAPVAGSDVALSDLS